MKADLSNPDIWAIESSFERTTLFLFTDEQVKKYKNSKDHKTWNERYFELIIKQDQFGYFIRDSFSIALDSKENFDKNYSSNWYHYYN